MSNDRFLQYDELGFIVGMKRTEKNVNNINQNIEQILKVLNQLLEQRPIQSQATPTQSPPSPRLSAYQRALNEANNIKPRGSDDLLRDRANPIIESTIIVDQVIRDIEEIIDEAVQQSVNPKNKKRPANTIAQDSVVIESHEDAEKQLGNRQRDSRGRFIGADGSNDNESVVAKTAESIGKTLKNMMVHSPQGVDPTIDAINEITSVLAPVKRAAGFMLRPLTGFFKSKKRNEPIPKEHADHNKEQQKSDKEQNRLLKLILGKREAREGGGGLGSLLGGRLVGRMLMGLFTRLIVPIIGLAGAFFGGYKLGEIIRDKVSGWIDTLTKADIPGRITNAWETFTTGLSAYFNEKWGNTKDQAGSFTDFGFSLVDKTLAKLGNKDAQERVRQREAGELGHQSTATNNTSLGQVYGDTKQALLSNKSQKGFNPMSEFKGGNINGLSNDETLAFANRVMSRENKSGKLGTVNPWGYTGKYQFGASALAETGFIDKEKLLKAPKGVRNGKDAKAHKAFLADKSNWVKGDWETYKNSQEMQDESFRKLTESNLKAGKNIHKGDKSKMMGFAMAAHLKGAGNAKKWYLNGVDSQDGNGTRTSDYAKYGEQTTVSQDAKESKVKELDNSTQNTTIPTTKSPIANLGQKQENTSNRKTEKNAATLSPVAPIKNTSSSVPGVVNPPQIPSKPNSYLEPVKNRISSSDPKKVLVVNQSNDNISQNVSDRALAHGLTGGIGERSV